VVSEKEQSVTTETMTRSAETPSMSAIAFAERGWLPDALIRFGIRRLCAERLRSERADGSAARAARFEALIETLRTSPVAIETAAANEQHYELPPRFFELCLGAHRKYSACWWDATTLTLDDAERAMLERYVERAELRDGQDILDLGCGWGSLTLFLATRFPNARIVAVSNSHAQRRHIETQCALRGLANVRVITCDVNELALFTTFDRVVSIEMFEHLRNYETILRRISGWLKPGGKLFVHIFCHRDLMYPFETEGEGNWMGRHFFTGGLMPSAETLLHFQDDLALEERWELDGTHYEKTANAWLENHDLRQAEVMETLDEAYGADAPLWNQRWRMFWMACAELFGYRGGTEWIVAHYRFANAR
jgi:cyclopropane-fatty-acyl-phospholipid synthase